MNSTLQSIKRSRASREKAGAWDDVCGKISEMIFWTVAADKDLSVGKVQISRMSIDGSTRRVVLVDMFGLKGRVCVGTKQPPPLSRDYMPRPQNERSLEDMKAYLSGAKARHYL